MAEQHGRTLFDRTLFGSVSHLSTDEIEAGNKLEFYRATANVISARKTPMASRDNGQDTRKCNVYEVDVDR